MKKLLLLLLSALMCVSLCACGGSGTGKENDENKYVKETDYVTIEGVYVDESYVDAENSNLKMVYVFYTAHTSEENIKISSKLSKMTINETNTYESETYQGACDFMPSYYFSDYLEEIYMGDSLKVVSTFKVPASELEAGREMQISPYGIPDGDEILIATDDIIFCSSAEEIAQKADPEGYELAMFQYKDADEETVKAVKEQINGYYWWFYVNSTYYEIEFASPDVFEVRALGAANQGTYTVKNGFITCVYSSNGYTVNIPYTLENGEILLDTTSAFDVH